MNNFIKFALALIASNQALANNLINSLENGGLYTSYPTEFPKTFTCKCLLMDKDTAKTKGCGLASPEKDWIEIDGVVWSSIIPQKEIASRLPSNESSCWHSTCQSDTGKLTTGHKCCLQKSYTYYNVFQDPSIYTPFVRQIAQYRNLRLEQSEIKGIKHRFGSCNFSITPTHFSEPTYLSGQKSRARLYLKQNHGLEYSNQDVLELQKISKAYPENFQEKQLKAKIKELKEKSFQYANPHIETPQESSRRARFEAQILLDQIASPNQIDIYD